MNNATVKELIFWIDNRQNLYTLYQDICKNLEKKIQKGIFDKELAKKAMYNLTVAAAKDYWNYNCSTSTWFNVFKVDDRMEAAYLLLENFLEERED